ncbi:MAG: NADAR domain-containing protein, partial [Candidatus Thorarchaeota archaeon]
KQLSEEDVENMRVVVRLKIEQHSGLKEDLLATGNDVIIENCTKRGKRGSNLFWGAVLEDGEWLGKNVLGNIWMELREEIKAERAKTLGIDPTK